MRVLIGCDDRPCPRGSIGQRGKDGRCKCAACSTAKKAYRAAWVARNRERANGYSRKWAAENPEKKRQAEAAWKSKNPEKVKEKDARAGAKWAKKRADKKAAARAKARAKLRASVPAWADLRAIESFYTEAARISRETGIPHEVDHIVPLAGEAVCGLHVETNLQIVPRTLNRQKGQRYEG